MRFKIKRMIALAVVCISMLCGCSGGGVTVEAPTINAPTIQAPTLPSIDIDVNKSVQDQVAQLTQWFKPLYCPIRMTRAGDALADEAKAIWNGIADRAKQDGLPVPAFDPKDPKMCQ